jgi:hypothetical protein
MSPGDTLSNPIRAAAPVDLIKKAQHRGTCLKHG